jgi:hypothetical protein
MHLAAQLVVYATFVGLGAAAGAAFARRWRLASRLSIATFVAALVAGTLVGFHFASVTQHLSPIRDAALYDGANGEAVRSGVPVLVVQLGCIVVLSAAVVAERRSRRA